MEQLLAAASVAASLLLVGGSIAAGWFLLWHAALKEIGFFRDIMGVNRPSPSQLAQRRAATAAEIERVKRQHSRGVAGRQHRLSGSGSRTGGGSGGSSSNEGGGGAAGAAASAVAPAALAAAPEAARAAAEAPPLSAGGAQPAVQLRQRKPLQMQVA
ncbi:hypothetical protein Rsub_00458 [Raphidocelis subcapitata]|uniref:Uncharacterized protein n=1 Tax=Raphidocelis subcapitata TaxID=307507 RepID=A0A2V0NS36_9CHLO|nr:hypothetical protein Rsub_00458 [Raphidocelis subcapitata]|eukprot:GBF87747.1 hypothetical protein Rsub_00458 [Raphidocelis subcapitata]